MEGVIGAVAVGRCSCGREGARGSARRIEDAVGSTWQFI